MLASVHYFDTDQCCSNSRMRYKSWPAYVVYADMIRANIGAKIARSDAPTGFIRLSYCVPIETYATHMATQ